MASSIGSSASNFEPAKLIAPISLGSLEEQKDKSKVSVIAMIPRDEVTTRKVMVAIIQLEDLTGL